MLINVISIGIFVTFLIKLQLPFRSHYFIYSYGKDYIVLKTTVINGFSIKRLFPICHFFWGEKEKKYGMENCPKIGKFEEPKLFKDFGIIISTKDKKLKLMKTKDNHYFRPSEP